MYCLLYLVVERSDVPKAQPAVVEDLGYRCPLVWVQLQHSPQQILAKRVHSSRSNKTEHTLGAAGKRNEDCADFQELSLKGTLPLPKMEIPASKSLRREIPQMPAKCAKTYISHRPALRSCSADRRSACSEVGPLKYNFLRCRGRCVPKARGFDWKAAETTQRATKRYHGNDWEELITKSRIGDMRSASQGGEPTPSQKRVIPYL